MSDFYWITGRKRKHRINISATYNLYWIKTGYKNKTGFNNIFLGGYAGYNNTTGNNNIFIGTGKDTTYSSNTIPGILTNYIKKLLI